MNILHIVMSDSFAGIEQHVNELAGVQKNNSNISLIVSSNIIKKFDKHLGTKEIKNFGRRSIYNIVKLSLLIKDINPDIVHSHGTKTTKIINIVKYFTSFKHVSTIHGIKKNLNAYEKADLVIGVSSKTLSNLKVQSKVVSNWWSPLLNNNSDDKTNEYALSVGKLERVKGFDLLIKGWQNISSNLVIIGTGKEYTKLKSLISSYKLEGKIKIIDFDIDPNKLKIFKESMIVRINKISDLNGLPYKNIYFKHMFSRWGSCSRINNISLNVLLYHLSEDLKDYVIKHELVHTKIKNHGNGFWKMLESICENSKKKNYTLNNSYFIKTY